MALLNDIKKRVNGDERLRRKILFYDGQICAHLRAICICGGEMWRGNCGVCAQTSDVYIVD